MDSELVELERRLDKKLKDLAARLALANIRTRDRLEQLDSRFDARISEMVSLLERNTALVESAHRAELFHGRVLSEHDARISKLEDES